MHTYFHFLEINSMNEMDDMIEYILKQTGRIKSQLRNMIDVSTEKHQLYFIIHFKFILSIRDLCVHIHDIIIINF